MPDLPDLGDLDHRLRALAGEYDQWRATAEAAVVRWEWYTWPGFDLQPLAFERELQRPGRPLPDRPDLDRTHLRIGFDAGGRPVAQREYSGFLKGKLYYETFWDYAALEPDGVVEQAHFYADGGPINHRAYRYIEGLMQTSTSAAKGGCGFEEYQYEGGRLARVTTYHAPARHRAEPRYEPFRVFDDLLVAWDGESLIRIERVQARGNQIVYERPPAGFSLDEATEIVRGELVRTIPSTVEALGITEPAFCLALAYFPTTPIEPMIYVGPDSYRQETLGQHDCEPDDLWGPVEYGVDEPVDVTAIADTHRLLAQELVLLDADHSDEPGTRRARELLCAVAAELNAHDWARVLPVTDDFIVYATDLELVDLHRNLVACVPADRLALLRKRKLVAKSVR